MDIEQLKQIDRNLKNNNEFVEYNKKNYIVDNNEWQQAGTAFLITIISVFFGVLCGISEFGCTVLGIVTMIISALILTTKTSSQKIELSTLEQNLITHNKNYYKNIFVKNTLKKFGNINKEVTFQDSDYGCQKLIANEDTRQLHLLRLSWNLKKYDVKENIQSCNYSEIIKYEVIDNSTSKQIATSVTSSNSDKALVGAVISKILIDDATAGAVIGSSSQKTTQTTYKTLKTNSYQINIFLNKLEDSLISFETSFKSKVPDIISILEYVIRQNQEV